MLCEIDGSTPLRWPVFFVSVGGLGESEACEAEDYDLLMMLSPKLLEILACPEDKGPLFYLADEATLYNPRLRRCYDVKDGIPVMLVDEARAADDAEHDRIMAVVSSQGISPTFSVESH